jgi:hypothetical protein
MAPYLGCARTPQFLNPFFCRAKSIQYTRTNYNAQLYNSKNAVYKFLQET